METPPRPPYTSGSRSPGGLTGVPSVRLTSVVRRLTERPDLGEGSSRRTGEQGLRCSSFTLHFSFLLIVITHGTEETVSAPPNSVSRRSSSLLCVPGIHRSLYTGHYIQANIHRSLYYAGHYTQVIIHRSLYTGHYTGHSLYTGHYTQVVIHRSLYTGLYTQVILHRSFYTGHYTQAIICACSVA